MKKPKVIGLTGGIGSGKSSVLELFKNKGVPVYIADVEAKNIMQNNAEVRDKIMQQFGENSYENNKLNTTYLAQIVFNDTNKLQQLNAIVHPAVQQHFQEYIKGVQHPFILYENAILFENGFDKNCDYIITVTAPLAVRIQRVIQRDNTTETKVLQRINNQWDEQKKINKSDFVIQNVDWQKTEAQFEKIYKKILSLIAEKK